MDQKILNKHIVIQRIIKNKILNMILSISKADRVLIGSQQFSIINGIEHYIN